MRIFDEITNEFIECEDYVSFVTRYSYDSIVLGYTREKDRLARCLFYISDDTYSLQYTYLEFFKGNYIYSNLRGNYLCTIGLTNETILRESNWLGCGNFPYSFNRYYEAIENFQIFENKQKLITKSKSIQGSKYLKYTFGLEFETSQGYIPEDICFRDGLIPLRDGSITGLEYSTIVLQSRYGLNLLNQQLKTLKEYTVFNKECSLHIHFGGFPADPDKVFRLYKICLNIEQDLKRLVPSYTFSSHLYKSNEKDYCKELKRYNNFDELYKDLVGRYFFGDFSQPHPNDPKRKAKWHISKRYYWCNLINFLCYSVNKTIEFRFLRPTYNFNKILLWIYIFNAILRFAETSDELIDSTISGIVNKVYPSKFSSIINKGITLLNVLTINQEANGDHIGNGIMLEERIFSERLFNIS